MSDKSRSRPVNNQFERLGVIAKPNEALAVETLTALLAVVKERGCHVTLDQVTASLLPKDEQKQYAVANRTALGASSDLIVVIGGDGTLLDAARSVARYNKPLVGINRGRLGFLVDVSPEDVESAMSAVLSGEYNREPRALLECEVLRGEQVISRYTALNDVVLNQPEQVSMLEFDTWANGELISRHRADGLIVCTATGSTAYALSSGGPIMHPQLDAMALVPICPHTLSDRPIVLPLDVRVDINLIGGTKTARITCDGHEHQEVQANDIVRIRRSEHKITLLHPSSYDYYAILRSKLHWGRK